MRKKLWKPIIGYESLYSVSNTGEIFSYRSNSIIRQQDSFGYKSVALYDKEGKCKRYRVHRVVAQTFLPNPNNLPQVNHIDSNKNNNSVCNLEWCTSKQNTNHAIKENNYFYAAHISKKQKPVYSLDREGNILEKYNTVAEASRKLGVSRKMVYYLLGSGKRTKKGLLLYSEREIKKLVVSKKDIRRKIMQKDNRGNVVARFNSVTEASRTNNIARSAVSNNLNGYTKLCGGFKYEYE